MASIRRYRTRGGEYRYAVRWREAGREREQAAGPRRADAARLKLEVERRLALGALYDAEPETLGAFLDGWLDRYKQRSRPGTVASTRSVLRVFDPLRRQRIDRISGRSIEDLVAAKAESAPAQAANALVKLCLALRDAERRGQRVDPAIFHVPKPRVPDAEHRLLTPEEVERIIGAMGEYGDAARFAVLTGIRRAEQFALTARDVDLERREVTIRRRTTKTDRGRRVVPLGDAAMSVAERLPRSGVVFPAPGGGRWTRSAFDWNVWHPALRRAGVWCRWHDLRHTFASWMIRAGVHPKVLQELLGHASISVTMDIYGHLFPSAGREAVRALDDALVGTVWGRDGDQEA